MNIIKGLEFEVVQINNIKRDAVRVSGISNKQEKFISVVYLKYLTTLKENELPDKFVDFLKKYKDVSLDESYLKIVSWPIIIYIWKGGSYFVRSYGPVSNEHSKKLELFECYDKYYRLFLIVDESDLEKIYRFRHQYPDRCSV